jgi:uncharacterized membrane protein
MKTALQSLTHFFNRSSTPIMVGASTLLLGACANQPTASQPSPAPAAPPVVVAPAPVQPVSVSTPAVATIDFDTKVQPFFSTYCFSCHGSTRQRGKTRFDNKAGILARVKPGDVENSTVYSRITVVGDDHMPPENSPDQPTPEEIAMIKQWISEGAKIPDSYPSGT